MPEPSDDRIGTLIDERYQITEVMASGAMGAVYKAERVPVGKLVAVKLLHASFASDSEFQARFERETRVMSKLNHPNCVSVLDFGVWKNEPYLVMDYVDGRTLRSILDEGALPPLEALAMARQILSGLAHAHQQDVFHRDVKPANIMVSEEIGHGKRLRILDFGLARLQGNVGRDATQTNVVVGTPNYMAPEQTVPGAAIDGRTDLYAVGVVLFEMIAGERPFNSEDTMQLLGMHRAAPVPRIADKMPPKNDLPIGVQEILDKALAKSPKDRYQTAIEFATAIDEVLAGKLDPMEIDATLPKMKSGPVATSRSTTLELGETQLKVDTSDAGDVAPRKRSSMWFGALLLLGGTAAMAAYLITRKPDAPNGSQKVVETETGSGSGSEQLAADAADTTPTIATGTGDASIAVEAPPVDAEVGSAAVAIAVDDAGVVETGDAAIAEAEDGDEDIQIDPAAAEDPDINAGSAAPPEDEDENAPKSEAEVEQREPAAPTPQLARTVNGAVALIKAGKKELALVSLRQLWKKQKRSSYIPFLLGNLYFDKKWWSVALDHYRDAIKKTPGYRKNAVLNRNVIRMMASPKTRQAATNFLRGVIGRSSKPYLKWAASNEKNPVVRREAARVARMIR